MQENVHGHPDLEARVASIENDIRLAKVGLMVLRWAAGVAIATGIIVVVQRLLA